MAFDPNQIAYAPKEGVYSLHIYKTTGDSLQTVASATATSYFTGYGPQTGQGDFVLAEASDGRGLFQITTQTTANVITLTPVGAAIRVPNTDDANNKFVFFATTADTLKTVASATATTYFATYGAMLNLGDVVYARGSDAQGLFRVTSADASTAPTLTPISDAFALSTTNSTASTATSLPPYGTFLSTITGTTQVFSLDMPLGPGQRKQLIHIGTSTAFSINTASTAAGAINTTMNTILFNAPNQAVELLGVSTSQWVVLNQSQPSTAIVGPAIS